MTDTFEIGDHVTWSQMKGVAFYIVREETETVYPEPWLVEDGDPDNAFDYVYPEEDDCTEIPTGNYVVTMVGDDREFIAESDDLTPLDEEEFCAGCGQIGCGHG